MPLMWTSRAALAIFALAFQAGYGQMLVDEREVRPEFRDFSPDKDEKRLECQVQPVKPAMNFAFRFQAGYVLRMPMKQFEGPGHQWAILMRVTPRDAAGQPAYLITGQRLPNVPPNKTVLEFGGGFLVGEGKYNVEWILADNAGRVCRKTWDIDAKPSRSERRIEPAMPANTVDDIAMRRTGRALFRKKDDVPDRQITVLLHATPLSPTRVRLRSYDRLLLLSSLATLVDRLPASTVRVVAFSLDQQKEIFRKDGFDRNGFQALARSLNELELGMVDYGVLKKRKGHVDLLTDLVTEELQAEKPSDAVVILGATARYFDKVPKSELEEKESPKPRFFYFQYKPYWHRGADFLDVVASAVKRIGGKTSMIRSPADFGKAIEQVSGSVIE